MPECQITHCPVIWKTLSETLQRTARQVEPQEFEFVFAEKVSDLWQRKLMFLNVEQQVAAAARTVKIEPVHDIRQWRTVARLCELVAAAPNILFG